MSDRAASGTAAQPDRTGLLDRLSRTRAAVLAQIAERDRDFPSRRITSYPWQTVTRMLQYIRDLTPENLLDIRIHTDPFIGTLSARFWLSKTASDFESLYRFYGEGVPDAYWAYEPELPALAGTDYGYRIGGRLLSDVATEYQRYVCNLYRLGMFQLMEQTVHRPVVLEIGAGHGGFAQLFAAICRRSHCYVIVDLPETLLFSAIFLNVHHPDKRIYTYAPGDDLEGVIADRDAYDFILVPDYHLSRLGGLERLDTAFNHVSFPEMPSEILREYLRFIRARLDGYLISVNYRGVPDTGRAHVDEVLSEYFTLSPTMADLAALLHSNNQVINDINCRPTIVCSSSIERRRQIAGRHLHDLIGTTGQRYVCSFQQDASILSLRGEKRVSRGWRRIIKRLARRTPVVRRLIR
ncbi:putative sugar O-methyltransferase [Nitrospira sp. BLG_2]|uniref:putative sugar O-methyltransferase n=1 Tax=Nitrospira sp. BLG_2 TaxID=3397507 RepID=UPI003B993813